MTDPDDVALNLKYKTEKKGEGASGVVPFMICYPHYCHNCNQSWLSKRREKRCKFCKSTNIVNDKERKE